MMNHASLPNHMPPTILIVDDIPANLSLLLGELGRGKYKVIVAENGLSALRRIAHVKPDLVLLDVMMPGIDGFETCRRLKASEKMRDIPIIFLTALTDSIDKVKGFAAGGVDYVTKPIDVIEVLARVRTHLTIAELRMNLQAHNVALEERVRKRTMDTMLANQELQHELDRRMHSEMEKDRLLLLVQEQLEQTRQMSSQLVDADKKRHADLIAQYNETIVPRIQALRHEIEQIKKATVDLRIDYVMLAHHSDTALAELERMEQWLSHIAGQAGVESAFAAENDRLLSLSSREREILRLLTDGQPISQIGQTLNVSQNTIRTYKARVLRKLNIDNMPDLVKFALRHEITTIA